jgi:hypothetical protein
MDELVLAYLAGVMDSDGWFTIKRHAGTRPYEHCFTYSESIGCGQTRPEAINMLQEAFGGPIRLRGRKNTGDWQPMYYWTISNKLAAQATATLRPHLRVKAEHADLIVSLRASKNAPRDYLRSIATGNLRGRALDPAVVAERHALYEHIRSLNDRRRSNTEIAALATR